MEKKLIRILIAVIIYGLSTCHTYNWISIAYGSEGRWSNLEPDLPAFIFTFTPVVNTIVTCINLFDCPYEAKDRTELNVFSKIFKTDNPQ
jgi:hypothetical protein